MPADFHSWPHTGDIVRGVAQGMCTREWACEGGIFRGRVIEQSGNGDKIGSFFRGQDPTRGSGQGGIRKLVGRVRSGQQEVFKISPVGSGHYQTIKSHGSGRKGQATLTRLDL